MQKLEQIRIQPELVLASEVIAQWITTVHWLAKSNDLEVQLKNDLSVSQLWIDLSVVIRVLENLVANGVGMPVARLLSVFVGGGRLFVCSGIR